MIYKMGRWIGSLSVAQRVSEWLKGHCPIPRASVFLSPVVNEAVHCSSLQHELGMSAYSCMVTKDSVSSLTQQEDFINGDFRNQSI